MVDAFLDRLDPVMARASVAIESQGPWCDFDWYKAPLKPDRTMRVRQCAVWADQVGIVLGADRDGSNIASKAFILENLVALEADLATQGLARGPGRIESARHGHHEVGQLGQGAGRLSAWLGRKQSSGVLEQPRTAGERRSRRNRPTTKGSDGERGWGNAANREADRLYGSHFYCPEGGHYLLSADGKTCRCSVHGSLLEPKQATEPAEKSSVAVLKGLNGVTASLTFIKEGLHAVVVIERK